MTTRLTDMLIVVAQDEDRLAAFLADPEPEMDAAGLTLEERDAVRNRDVEAIEQLTGGASLFNWAGACMMVSPHFHVETQPLTAGKLEPRPAAKPKAAARKPKAAARKRKPARKAKGKARSKRSAGRSPRQRRTAKARTGRPRGGKRAPRRRRR